MLFNDINRVLILILESWNNVVDKSVSGMLLILYICCTGDRVELIVVTGKLQGQFKDSKWSVTGDAGRCS